MGLILSTVKLFLFSSITTDDVTHRQVSFAILGQST